MSGLHRRRRLLGAFAAAGIAPAGRLFGAPSEPVVRLAAAWSRGREQAVGVLGVAGGRATVLAQVAVPTRAHGLLAEPGGTLLAVARRPGEWLLRWRADGRVVARQWIEPQRRFNGHLLASHDGRWLFSTETDTGGDDERAAVGDRSLIGVREAVSLEKIAEWPTHGLDAHQLLLDGDGHLLVANGGVPSRAEDSGRLRLAQAPLDASLVRLDGTTGERLGQWRLADPWLSPRHLAHGAVGATSGRRRLGIALQAEHPDAAARATAPVLALFDGDVLRPCALPPAGAGSAADRAAALADAAADEAAAKPGSAGYGGDIAWLAGRWAVSCPRADGLAWWHADGRWHRLDRGVAAACALAADGAAGTLWCGGGSVGRWHGERADAAAVLDDATLRLDNHWLRLPA